MIAIPCGTVHGTIGNGSAFELCPSDDDDLCALPWHKVFNPQQLYILSSLSTSLSKAVKREPGVAFGWFLDGPKPSLETSQLPSHPKLRLAFVQAARCLELRGSGKIHRQNVYLNSVEKPCWTVSARLSSWKTQQIGSNNTKHDQFWDHF